ncbi:alpha-D-xyloside xylohydrolase [Paenibacillus sp. UNCCL117]|uniref:alpha-xylosidase n=1 Tax=unclassified Paenibacillus TaxID=185978 RepID=UPI000880C52B|nr:MULTISPECIES: alpha-xylosidase [unclassified Paenibacillus]SDD90029.1 alpha-D-xyloside xylohydrolase [Paenibacillus sp. cl123]SFW44016.1 alpha-D-xyloside xylohydrolase [Paenibacillus sp. UNCCL117]
MKFTDGYWGIREGVDVQYPTAVRDVQTDGERVTVYAATRMVERKGHTLNGALLTAELSSPMPDVIRVRWTHHAGKLRRGPAFAINEEASAVTVDASGEERIVMQAGRLQAVIRRSPSWGLEFFYNGRRLTGTANKGAAYVRAADGSPYFREMLDLGIGEQIYGLGERFTPFVKNGQTVDIWNEDGGTSSEQAYKNVPFYLSSAGYGVFVNHPGRVSYEIASEVVSKVGFSVPGETLEYMIVGGETLKDVLNNYTKLTGRPALPPAWSFGLWLTTSFTTDYDEATVTGFIEGMAERRIPLHVFHFDCFWMKEYQWCDFEWDADMFPDPEGMLRRLKERGLRICVWINSYIAQKSPLFEEGARNGYLVRTKEGDVWQWDRWQAGMGLVDFTNPEAVKWYQSKLKRLLEMGVDCFKTDFGERIPTDVVYYDGSDPINMHNYYTHLYNKAVFEVLEEHRGKHEAMLFARSATAGGQQYPVHWGGDCSATYDSMAETLRGGLSLGLSGFGFWSHDISGFERTAPPDIYKRWVAFGMLSSHSRLHGNESYRVPWLFDEEAVDVLRLFTELKCRLMPYLFGYAVEATQKGLPVMRAMVLEFPQDMTCHYLDRQYMLGERLLVAPIFNTEGSVAYYVPEGRWTNLLTGETVTGGRWHRERHGYMTLPLLVRPNSLIALGANRERPDYDYVSGTELHLFELESGATAAAALHDLSGERQLDVEISRAGDMLDIVATGGAGKPWQIVLRGLKSVDSVEGGEAEGVPEGIRITPNAPAIRVKIGQESSAE